MKNENRNEEAVSPVIATILMVAITVVLAGVLFVWASSLAEGNTDGNLALYAFSGKDAQGTPGTDGTDNLIMLTMDQGGDINWASISVKLAIDGAAPVTCDNPGVDGTAVCSLVEFGDDGDQVWSVGDGVTVVENGQDLCSGACSIDVTITDTREGKTIDTTNGVPAE
jgi:flagellin-like protein